MRNVALQAARSGWGLSFFAITAIGTIGAFNETTRTWFDFLLHWVADSSFVAEVEKRPTINAFGRMWLIFPPLFMTGAGIYIFRDRTKVRDQSELKAKYRSELLGMVSASEEIVEGMYPAGNRTRLRFTKVFERYEIDEFCNGTVTREYMLEAGADPIQVWRASIWADASAEPIDFVGDLDLKVSENVRHLTTPENGSNNRVKFLIGKNDPTRKLIAVFFLPQIEPQEQRVVRMTYKWPRFANDLAQDGVSRFRHEFETSDLTDTADITMEFVFSSKLGDIFGEESCQLSDTESFGLLPRQPGEEFVFVYRGTDVKVDQKALGFTFRKTAATGA
jgi:hypothetical protein